MGATAQPFGKPLYVMAKPAGPLCNLACDYCYYTEKAHLYEGGKPVMADSVLEEFVKQYIEAQTQSEVVFTWHGGEPLVRPLDFYKKAVALQRRYAGGRRIANCLQTNGTMLDGRWCGFLAENGWLVGLSIDGPAEFHDEYRRNHAGKGSFQKVMNAVRLLQKHGVEWNAMAVVNEFNADHPSAFYRFFKEIGCRYIQFAPIVERIAKHGDGRHLASPVDSVADMAPFSVTPRQYGSFLCSVFDEWVAGDVGEVFVQLFDSTLALWVGEQPGVCTMARYCGHAAAMEHNGDLYCCDHFVFPEYKLGNIRNRTITEMMASERQGEFGDAKRKGLPGQCLRCRWLDVCNGGCPKDRFCKTDDGEPGLNYLCCAYQAFFSHVEPYMDFMAAQLRKGLPPANVMEAIREGRFGK